MHCLKYIIRLISSHRLNFYRAMLSMRGSSHGPVSVCVCHKSPSRCSTETAKRRITQTAPHDSPGNLVYWRQRSPRNFTGAQPVWGRQMQVGWVKIGDFRQITGYISKTISSDTTDRQSLLNVTDFDVSEWLIAAAWWRRLWVYRHAKSFLVSSDIFLLLRSSSWSIVKFNGLETPVHGTI